MNKYVKKGLSVVLAAGLIASSFAGCAKINYVTEGAAQAIHEIKDGSWQNQDEDAAGANSDADVSVLEKSFEANTYGGVEFKDLNDVAAYYKEAYDYTKTLTAQYIDADGNEQTFYKLLGDEDMVLGGVMIDGKENSVINSIVPGIAGSLFSKNTYGLVPCNNRNPEMDNNLEDDTRKADHDFRTSDVTGDDILDANITDNGDGTITMVIQPKAAQMSTRGDDSQGKFFEVLGDIGGVVGQIDQITFTQGTPEENVIVEYKGSTATVKIDTKTKEILEADYNMIANVAVTHASIAVIKDKSASLTITYTNHYPASDEYLMTEKQLKRK
ncbi:MAG: hypothetical protein NC213_05865 [Acetobacter sp.]|nr:hypothetical protein [Bacteroides sp.]MCM1341255.1 hypothetical protein [Acetobacter sp.]MCM1433968.1 hypothetical protein [Clostridiales bacterium]